QPPGTACPALALVADRGAGAGRRRRPLVLHRARPRRCALLGGTDAGGGPYRHQAAPSAGALCPHGGREPAPPAPVGAAVAERVVARHRRRGGAGWTRRALASDTGVRPFLPHWHRLERPGHGRDTRPQRALSPA